MAKSYIYPKLPQTGLANMLFVWARAEVMSKKYNLPILGPEWFKPFRIGPWMRREKYKRYYLNEFTNSGYVNGIQKLFLMNLLKKRTEKDLYASKGHMKDGVFVFDGPKGYFSPIIGYEEQIKESLYKIIKPSIKEKLLSRRDEYIGIHIRRGDFKGIGQDIPIGWYVKTAEYLRKKEYSDLPVLVFTDALDSEVREIREIENVVLMPKAPAIHDLLMLAESKVIIGTSLSTFSLWASYLNRRATIWSPVSPGVYGYGLSSSHHIQSGWSGEFSISEFEKLNVDV